MIVTEKIFWADNSRFIKNSIRSRIQNSTKSKALRLFNLLPTALANMTIISTDTSKKHLDGWLSRIPDQHKIDDYDSMVGMVSNSLVD